MFEQEPKLLNPACPNYSLFYGLPTGRSLARASDPERFTNLSQVVLVWPERLNLSDDPYAVEIAKESSVGTPLCAPFDRSRFFFEPSQRVGGRGSNADIFEALAYPTPKELPVLKPSIDFLNRLEFHFKDGTFATLANILFVDGIEELIDLQIFSAMVYHRGYSTDGAARLTDSLNLRHFLAGNLEIPWDGSFAYSSNHFLAQSLFNCFRALVKACRPSKKSKENQNDACFKIYLTDCYPSAFGDRRRGLEILNFDPKMLRQSAFEVTPSIQFDSNGHFSLEFAGVTTQYSDLSLFRHGLAYRGDAKILCAHNFDTLYFESCQQVEEAFFSSNVVSRALFKQIADRSGLKSASSSSPRFQVRMTHTEILTNVLRNLSLTGSHRSALDRLSLCKIADTFSSLSKSSFKQNWVESPHIEVSNSTRLRYYVKYSLEPVATSSIAEGKVSGPISFCATNLPLCVLKFFDRCKGGMIGVVPEHEIRFYRRDDFERSLCWKIARHRGFLLFAFYEYCNFVLGQPLTSGEMVPTREKLLEVVWANLVMIFKTNNQESAGLSSVRLDKALAVISKSMIELIDGFYRKIESIHIDMPTPIGGQRFFQFTPQHLSLYRVFLEMLIEESRGTIFLRERSDLFNRFFNVICSAPGIEYLQTPTEDFGDAIATYDFSEVFTKVNPLPRFLDLVDSGYKVRIDQREVKLANEDDLTMEIRVNASAADLDFFELNPKVFFKGSPVELTSDGEWHSGNLMEYQGVWYRIPKRQLPRLKSLERFWQKITRKSGLQGRTTPGSSQIVRLPRSLYLELLCLYEAGIPVEGTKEWLEVQKFFNELSKQTKGRSEQQLARYLNNAELDSTLKEYQRTGASWLFDLYRLRLGALLADDMGLGKTLQILAFLNMVRTLGDSKAPNLIVVPSSLVYNWMAEAEKFVPSLALAHWGQSSKEELKEWFESVPGANLVVSYGILYEHDQFFNSIQWNVVVFDEAQHLKNISTKRTSQARKLKTRFKVGLSGTPFENNLRELYSVMDLVLPGALGELSAFAATFDSKKIVTSEALDHLKKVIKPIVLRRTKAEVLLELPEKSETELKLDFSKEQLKLYKNLAASQNEQVGQTIRCQGEARSQLQMLTALLRLRQVCSDPSGLPNIQYREVPPKVELLLDTIRDHREKGESLVVFTQFRVTLQRILALLVQEGVPHYSIDGSTSLAKRKKELESFDQCEEPSVLVMTLKTGGVGLNLTKASVVIHLEPWWNPAVENQGTDRVHRMGQNREVSVYRYIMKESLEEKIQILKDRKQSTFNLIFGEDIEGAELDSSKTFNQTLQYQDFKFLIGSPSKT